ncbi:MAG: HU family DNA-binding protein [Prevotella sp.]|uniref:HU family DNA-binding protein n=1 Tax=Prevotella sp. TaxID=59823 RepID=UPI002A283094|nr:HU family DNA-binding protein [Prevotella sp.]MDD7318659.1 HU family DNA-binding protein [Prevotellaceae bacterium]MDY4019385.1 HU family DNA-binding protein [Prevotella sp.]
MNNKDFIQRLSQRLGMTQDDTQATLNKAIDIMGDIFQEGNAVQFPNFGTFEVKKRLERIVVNPGTKQRMLVPPKLVLGFKPVASVKEKLKNGGAGNE